ncbi:MAG: DUF4190 domain-containing protein [Beutenbergiaceae bacterium]
MSAPGFAPLNAPRAPYAAADLAISTPTFLAVDSPTDIREPVDPNTFVNEYTRPLPNYHETFSGPGYLTKKQPTSATAVIALVCGLLGFVLAIPALVAIVCGHVALFRTRRNAYQGRGMALGGLVLGYGLVTMVGLLGVAGWVASL